MNSHESQLTLATWNQDNLVHDPMIQTSSTKGSSWQISYRSYVLTHRESRRGQSINDWESWHHHYWESSSSSSLHPHSRKEKSRSRFFHLNHLLPSTSSWSTGNICADPQVIIHLTDLLSVTPFFFFFCYDPRHLKDSFDDRTEGLLTQLC